MRIRFHSVGGYGTIATGKLLTDILAGVLGMHSKSAPKYGSEKSGAPDQLLHHPEPRAGPDHQRRARGRRGRHLARTTRRSSTPTRSRAWSRAARSSCSPTCRPRRSGASCPATPAGPSASADPASSSSTPSAVAKKHAPTPDLETRMMGIAFIGAVAAHVDRVSAGRLRARRSSRRCAPRSSRSSAARATRSSRATWPSSARASRRPRVVDYDDARVPRDRRAPAGADRCTPSRCRRPCAARSSARQRPVRPGLLRGPDRAAVPRGHHRRGAGAARHRPVHAGRHGGRQGQGPVPAHRARVPRRPVHRLHGVRPGLPGRRDPQHRARDPRPAAHRRSRTIDVTDAAARGPARAWCTPLAERVREAYRAGQGRPRVPPRSWPSAVADARRRPARRCGATSTSWSPTLAIYPGGPHAARSSTRWRRPAPGTGGLFAATIDPWKCTGCLECIEVCGPGALTAARPGRRRAGRPCRSASSSAPSCPNTPKRFSEGAIGAGRRPQAPDARPPQLLRHHRRSRRAAAAAARSPRSGW